MGGGQGTPTPLASLAYTQSREPTSTRSLHAAYTPNCFSSQGLIHGATLQPAPGKSLPHQPLLGTWDQTPQGHPSCLGDYNCFLTIHPPWGHPESICSVRSLSAQPLHIPQIPSRKGPPLLCLCQSAPSPGASPFPPHPCKFFPTGLPYNSQAEHLPPSGSLPSPAPPLFQNFWHAPATTLPAVSPHVCLPLGQRESRGSDWATCAQHRKRRS